jgi:hypothetical protein
VLLSDLYISRNEYNEQRTYFEHDDYSI